MMCSEQFCLEERPLQFNLLGFLTAKRLLLHVTICVQFEGFHFPSHISWCAVKPHVPCMIFSIGQRGSVTCRSCFAIGTSKPNISLQFFTSVNDIAYSLQACAPKTVLQRYWILFFWQSSIFSLFNWADHPYLLGIFILNLQSYKYTKFFPLWALSGKEVLILPYRVSGLPSRSSTCW